MPLLLPPFLSRFRAMLHATSRFAADITLLLPILRLLILHDARSLPRCLLRLIRAVAMLMSVKEYVVCHHHTIIVGHIWLLLIYSAGSIMRHTMPTGGRRRGGLRCAIFAAEAALYARVEEWRCY